MSCGCYFDPTGGGSCFNAVSGTDCPGLYDLGQNFGQGFFQDHHFHFGYHVYAAAVVRVRGRRLLRPVLFKPFGAP